MPAATPENWAKARHHWETTPGLTLTDVAKDLAVAVPTVSIRAKRENWCRVEHQSLADLDVSPAVIAEQAIYRLHRLVMESKDENVVLKACAMLLDRTMGKVVEPPPHQDGVPPALPSSSFQPSPNRLSYAADPPEPEPAEPARQHQSPQEAPKPPEATIPPATLASPLPAPIPPRREASTPTPTFWDGPGRPAPTGSSYREVTRST